MSSGSQNDILLRITSVEYEGNIVSGRILEIFREIEDGKTYC